LNVATFYYRYHPTMPSGQRFCLPADWIMYSMKLNNINPRPIDEIIQNSHHLSRIDQVALVHLRKLASKDQHHSLFSSKLDNFLRKEAGWTDNMIIMSRCELNKIPDIKKYVSADVVQYFDIMYNEMINRPLLL